MRRLSLLDLTLPGPEENLALEEALLLRLETTIARGGSPEHLEMLRFWESPSHFVTLGVSGKLHAEVDVEACRREGVPVLRRASGGGTVVQGPGCLNFTLVLGLDDRPELRDVTRSYVSILSRIGASLGTGGMEHRGTSDLAVGELKVSGNAQKRTRHALLHHGTLLYDFDLKLVPLLLKEPASQPEYRRRRSHADFIVNLPLEASTIKSRIAQGWHAAPDLEASLPDLKHLVEQKYGHRDWTERF